MKTINGLRIALRLGVIGITGERSFAATPENVLRDYLGVQSTLARDSMKNVSLNAHALADAVRGDSTKSLPAIIAEQADALAKAKNLDKARNVFKRLSESLIAHVKTNGAPRGTYYEVYCPIAKASWLQAGETVSNPYLGTRAATPTWGWACSGVVKAKFTGPPGKDQTDGGLLR